jgi:hypothetical protein
VAGKILSARLVNIGAERHTAVIAACTAVAAIVLYTMVAPRYGGWGVAAASVILLSCHTLATATTLRLPAKLKEEQGEFV